jgi:flagellar basal-body rod protein FlgC
MSIFNSMGISASGLSLERLKMDVISTNITNINTSRTEDGGPYRRKEVLFEEILSEEKTSSGVRVTEISEDENNMKITYNPDHPDADENGYLLLPNVNMADEMINLIKTQRTFEANVTALNTSKNLLKKALEISKG